MKDKYLKTKNNYLILISLICLMGTLLFPDFSSAACDAGHIDNLDGTCTATFYPNADPETSSIDGSAGQGGGANLWNSLVAGTGNDYQSSQTSWEVALIYSYAPDGNWYYLRRGIFLFDTSALPDDANISAATLSIRGQGKVDNLNINPNVNIYSSAPASNNVIVPGDFDSFGSTAFCDTPITYAGWSTTGYNDFILNAAGMAAISKTGVSKFGTRNVNYDVANIEPTWSSTKDSRLYGYYAEAGEGYQPKLVVTYTDESSDTTPPVISSISAASIAETSAQINWTTNEGATSQVEYGTTISYGSLTTLNSNLVTSRLLTLTGLSSNTLYYYRVRSKDASDNEAISSNQTFSTLSPPPPPPLFWSGWGAINTIYYNPSQEDPDNPFLYTAAQDLRTYLQQMSGRSWTVVTNASPAPPAIYLSVNAAQLSGRGDEAFRLVANGNGVTITCKTAIACRHGAYYLLDEKLGVRWFGKGDEWTIVPATLANLSEIDIIKEPDFFWRMAGYDATVDWQKTADWTRHNRMLGAKWYGVFHSYEAIINAATGWSRMDPAQKTSYYNAHTTEFTGNNEWGNSAYPSFPWQLNPANTSIRTMAESYARSILGTLKSGGEQSDDELRYALVSISPNDGSGWTPQYTTNQAITNATFALTSAVADSLAAAYPGSYFGVLNYSDYASIPAGALNPNVLVLVTQTLNGSVLSNAERITGLLAKGVEVGWYDYVNVAVWGHDTKGLDRDLINTVKWLHSLGVAHYHSEAADTWGNKGMTFYILSKLLWDAGLDVETLVDDYIDKSFGAAAGSMAEFYALQGSYDDVAMAYMFKYLAQARTDAAGDASSLARIRDLEYWARYVWKYYNEGYKNLSNAELEGLYTFVCKARDTYMISYAEPEYYIRTELIRRGYSSVRVDALKNYTVPTVGEATTWLAEATAHFSTDVAKPAYVNIRRYAPTMSLTTLGDTVTADKEPLMGIGRDILVYSSGNESVTVRAKTAHDFLMRWYSPYGVLMEDWRYTASENIWVTHNFTATVPGWYIIHTTRIGTPTTIGTMHTQVDVQGRPASIVAEGPRRSLYREEFDSNLFNAPEITGTNDQYFYVPVGTTGFAFGARVTSVAWPTSGSLIEPNTTAHDFSWTTDNEMTITNPAAGLWTLHLNNQPINLNYVWFRGIPPFIWHDPQYLLVKAGEVLLPPPPTGFTLSNTNQLYFFRDKSNLLQIAGNNFNLSTNFSIQFLQNSSVVSSFTAQPQNSSTFQLSLTSIQINTLPVGFYDLKVVRTTDSVSQTYSKQILITTLGDIWSSAATDASEQKRDGKVDIYDTSRMFSKWGSALAADLAEADINPGPANVSQNKIDLFDANRMMSNWRP